MEVILDAGISVGLASGVASEECNYAPDIHAGGGIMTECGLVLLASHAHPHSAVIPAKAGIQRHATEGLRHLSHSRSYSLSSTWSNVLKNTHIGPVFRISPIGSFPS